MLTADWRSEIEVKIRITIPKQVLTKDIFYSSVDLKMTKRLMKCIIIQRVFFYCTHVRRRFGDEGKWKIESMLLRCVVYIKKNRDFLRSVYEEE